MLKFQIPLQYVVEQYGGHKSSAFKTITGVKDTAQITAFPGVGASIYCRRDLLDNLFYYNNDKTLSRI